MPWRKREWTRPGAAQPLPDDTWQEWVKELRQRTHDLAEQVGILSADLDIAKRERQEIRDELRADARARIELKDALESEKLAESVSRKLAERRRFWASFWTRSVAAGAAIATVAAAIKVLIGG